jgi:hypothetical protein
MGLKTRLALGNPNGQNAHCRADVARSRVAESFGSFLFAKANEGLETVPGVPVLRSQLTEVSFLAMRYCALCRLLLLCSFAPRAPGLRAA